MGRRASKSINSFSKVITSQRCANCSVALASAIALGIAHTSDRAVDFPRLRCAGGSVCLWCLRRGWAEPPVGETVAATLQPFSAPCRRDVRTYACAANFAPLTPQIWGEHSFSPPDLGDLGGCVSPGRIINPIDRLKVIMGVKSDRFIVNCV